MLQFCQINLLCFFFFKIAHVLICIFLMMKVKGHSVVSDSFRPHGLYSLWNSPGQDIGVGSHFLLQETFPTQGSNSGLPHCRQIFYQLSHQGSPVNDELGLITFLYLHWLLNFFLFWGRVISYAYSLFIFSSILLLLVVMIIDGLPRWCQWVKNLPASAGSKRRGFDPWVGKIPWRKAWQLTPVFLPGEPPWTKDPGGLQWSIGLQRVRHDWSNLARTHAGIIDMMELFVSKGKPLSHTFNPRILHVFWCWSMACFQWRGYRAESRPALSSFLPTSRDQLPRLFWAKQSFASRL